MLEREFFSSNFIMFLKGGGRGWVYLRHGDTVVSKRERKGKASHSFLKRRVSKVREKNARGERRGGGGGHVNHNPHGKNMEGKKRTYFVHFRGEKKEGFFKISQILGKY